MSIIGKIRKIFEKKDHGLVSKEDRIFWAGLDLSAGKWGRVAAAVRAGNVIASGMGMMPVLLDGKENSEADRLLNIEPCELLTAVEFREMLTMHAVFTGTGRALIRRSTTRGTPIEMIPLHPDHMLSEWQLIDGEYRLFVSIHEEGISGYFRRQDVLEITNPRWEMIKGLNVTHECRNVLGLAAQLQDRQAALSNKNSPYGVLTISGGGSKEAIRALKESWKSQFGQTGIAVIDMDARFDQMMQSAADQQLLETMEFQVTEIARMYGVHPYLLMQTKGSGAQGAVSDAMIFHQAYTMAPWVARWEAALVKSLFKDSDTRPKFDESVLMRTTPDQRAGMYAKALGAGGNRPWMTEDEVRAGKSPFRLDARGDDFWQARGKDVMNETQP